MILIVENESTSCDWTVLNSKQEKILKTRTVCFNLDILLPNGSDVRRQQKVNF